MLPALHRSAAHAFRPRSFPRRLVLALVAAALGGCASSSSDSGPAANSANDAAEARGPLAALPAALGGRFTPPPFATRVIEGERGAVLDAAVAAADALGYRVARFDGARGRIEAARAPESSFEGRTQETLELSVQALSPGQVTVAVVLRESFEAEGQGGAAIVRDRAAYDAIFERLANAAAAE
jgi:hypothetical protein